MTDTIDDMDINIIDAIPKNKPHCLTCINWNDCGKPDELFAYCKIKKEKTPSFAMCEMFEAKDFGKR